MEKCVFCRIVSGEMDSKKVYEDDETYAFLDINPANTGHLLVVPKEHSRDIFQMEDELAGKLFRAASKLSSALDSALDPDGINIIQSNGKAAGQEVSHAHVHVVPRYQDDDVKLDFNPGNLDRGKETAEKIRREV